MIFVSGYKVHEFAKLAGVTVKALHHYDRLGLLQPSRTTSGYRIYREDDLQRLEQIIALKFLGVPLKQIKAVLDRTPAELQAALRMQRDAIEEKREHLARAIRAIRAAEEALESGQPASAAILKKIIEVIEMQNDVEVMKRYYSSEEEWQRRKRYYEEGPSQEWQQLYRDIVDSLDADPAGDRAQDLAGRWLHLSMRACAGDAEHQTDSRVAWMDREHWPPTMKRRMAEFNLEAVNGFVQRASANCRKKYFSEDGWRKWVEIRMQAPMSGPNMWQVRVDLFRDIHASIGGDPASERAQSLASRWSAHLEQWSQGDTSVKQGLLLSWADRKNWSPILRWVEVALTRLRDDEFDQAADFLDAAVRMRS